MFQVGNEKENDDDDDDDSLMRSFRICSLRQVLLVYS
jgi:hypothetical protein